MGGRINPEHGGNLGAELTPKQREGVQGQFGIGILGFAAVGGELTLRSRRSGSATRSIRLHAYSTKYETDGSSRPLPSPGTEAEIKGVHREIQNRLTAEKLHRYLSEELRDRIRRAGVRIQIDDQVGVRKTLVVTPREFSGAPLVAGQKQIPTKLGPLKLDLYFAAPKEDERPLISLARNGTRVQADLLDCDELRHEPWDLNLIEGVIDFPALRPSPATRRGFVPDGAYEELLSQLRTVEPGLKVEVEQRRKLRDERLSKEMLEKLRRAFAEAMEELSEDYSWFERPGSDIRGAPGKRFGGSAGTPRAIRLSAGPLEEVRISPKIALVAPNEIRALSAKAYDPSGALIPSGVSFSWWTGSPLLSLRPEGQAATIEAKTKEGEAPVRVTARLKGVEKQAEAQIVIATARTQVRFPPPDFVHAPLESWRSKYSADLGVVKINSGHRDYERAKSGGVRQQMRYLAKLYAKELVLLNVASMAPAQLLESMVELTTVLESKL
jgi:hypothetical protein